MDEGNLIGAADKATDIVADAVEGVAHQAEGAAKTVRSLNRIKVAYASLGMVIGATTAALVTWRIAYSRANTKYSQISDEEIEAMQKHYQDKVKSLELTEAKGDLDDIVAERGYTVPEPAEEDVAPPMAITPPAAVVEAAKDALLEAQPDESTVVKEPHLQPETRNVFDEATVEDHWDDHAERAHRSPDSPYVIHVDEKGEFDDYTDVTWTYYEADDVLCNEKDEIIDPTDRERLVGEQNLNKFGHGSKDAAIVYIRNDQLEMEIEIVRSPNSYAEEVHGFTHGDNRSNIERMRARERAEFDDE